MYRRYVLMSGGSVEYPKLENMSMEDIIEKHKDGLVPFPYMRYYNSSKTVIRRFNNLREFRYKLINVDYQLRYVKDVPKDMLLYRDADSSDPKPTVLLFDRDNYLKYDLISDYFQEEQRVKCKRQNEQYTPYEYFYDTDKFIDILKKAKDRFTNITAYSLREAVFMSVAECSSFRPTVLVSIIKMFNSRRVLDMCSGWGDRLIACMAMDVEYYFGADPNCRLQKGYSKMIEFFGRDKNRYKTVCSPFEDADIELYNNKRFDLIMTSPPYFDFETYTEDENQSVKNRGKDEWLKRFMLPSLEKAWMYLESGGMLALNINNTPTDFYVYDIIRFVNGFSDSDYRGCLSYTEYKKNTQRLRNPQPIWIWKKL